jgi:hypothetical protein
MKWIALVFETLVQLPSLRKYGLAAVVCFSVLLMLIGIVCQSIALFMFGAAIAFIAYILNERG